MEKAQENVKCLKNNLFQLMSSILDRNKMYFTTKQKTSSLSLFLTGEAKSVEQGSGIMEVEGAVGGGEVTDCNAVAIPQGRVTDFLGATTYT